jgi:hypothetical protein
MTGPEHYRAAELHTEAADLEWKDSTPAQLAVTFAAAQAHATLALVAATLDASRGPVKGEGAWHEVLA